MFLIYLKIINLLLIKNYNSNPFKALCPSNCQALLENIMKVVAPSIEISNHILNEMKNLKTYFNNK